MKILDLFIAASIPVLKFLIVTALGLFLAIDSIDVMGEDARNHLNRVVFYVFNPALIAVNLAKTVTFESMVTLWFMPLNILFTYIIGSALGWIVIKISRPPSHLKGLILGCCSAGNMGSMLLVVIPSICKEKGSPFRDSDVCYNQGMAYVSLSMAIGAIYLWSYVYNILRISATNQSERTSKPSSGSSTEALLSSDDCSSSENHTDMISLGCTKKIVGFVIGIVPQVRKSMIGTTAPLRVIQDSASLLGDGSVPLLTLIVGGNLKRGLKDSGTQASLIVGVVIVRYILLPLSGVLIVKKAVHLGFVLSSPLYQFILLLQFAVPPALNIGTITQLFGAGESEYSVIMLWTYALASVSLTFWSTLFMCLVLP